MSNTFNINRFGLLLKRQWLEFGKIFLVSLLVIAGVIIAFYGFNIPNPEGTIADNYRFSSMMNFREPLFIITGFLFITIISSNYFAPMGNKPKAMIELMIPGSTLEKFLAAIFYTALVTTASYFLIYYIIDVSFVSYISKTFDGVKLTGENGEKYAFSITALIDVVQPPYTYPFYALPFAVSSLFLLGSIYFNRFHYIKTAVSVMIFSGVLSYFLYKTGKWIFDGKMRVMHNQTTNHMTETQAMCMIVGLIAALTLVFWVIGYVRLKEKEV